MSESRIPPWTDEQVARVLYVATALPQSDPQGADFWQAADAFSLSEHAIDRKRLKRETARAYELVERRLSVEVRQLAQQLRERKADGPAEAWLRRQLDGLGKEGA